MDRALVKPLSRSDLVAMIEGLRPAPPAHEPDGTPPDRADVPEPLRLRILAELHEGFEHLSRVREAALAHRLAGSAAVLGLTALNQGLIALERTLLRGEGGDQIREDLRKLQQMLDNYCDHGTPTGPEPRRQAGSGP